ncbi:unnamed protein product [Linum trigynum]|uniref:SOUL heme-binding protein n=1 Tax=Linum trigynum TaxID=586398 RepID=A0AAV2CTL1_9ROSI
MAATAQFSLQIPFPSSHVPSSSSSVASRRLRQNTHIPKTLFRPILSRPTNWAIRMTLSPVDQKQASSDSSSDSDSDKGSNDVDMAKLVDFLYEDLPHLFDERGIDRTAYDDYVQFRDPITRHDDLDGYLMNIAALKHLFRPKFQLHWVKQTGSYEITTRWTMVMRFIILPWQPELVFTGTSVMGVNPKTGKFCSHADYWDSVSNNQFFSPEGLWDVIQQLRIYKTPDRETPKYEILKRTAVYEVRKYKPFMVVETTGDHLAGSGGFSSVTGYIFGNNTKTEVISMTTPVFTEAKDPELSKVAIQVVLPLDKDFSNLPEPIEDDVRLKKMKGGFAAVHKFSGKPTEEITREKEKVVRSCLVRDGLSAKPGCLLARYNDPTRTWSSIMRNEVLIWLEDFSLD